MASGRMVFFLLAILASLSCAISDSSSREDHGPPSNGPPSNGPPSNGPPSNGPPSNGLPPNGPSRNGPPPSDHHHSPSDDDNEGRAFGLPNLGQLFGFGGGSDSSNSSASNPISDFAATISQFFPGLGGSGFPNLFSAFMPHSGRSGRVDLIPGDLGANNNTEDIHPHDRFFFSLFNHFGHSVPIGCNYTTQAGYSCAGCREQLLCNSNNVGRIRICPFYAPYCYNGVCGSVVNSTCTNSTG